MNYLSRKQDLKTKCILEILTAKRLLVDHLEVAEVCLRFTPNIGVTPEMTKVPLKTICAVCLASVAASTRFLPSYATGRWQIMVTSIGSSILLGAILYEKLFYYRDLKMITNLIGSIEQYDTAAKRMLIFVNEVIHGNERLSSARRSEIELLETCVESFTKVIYELYDYAKALEERTKLREECSDAYDPPESFADCEILKQTTANHSQAKQLYNIFLYMQSHCLLRLALAVACDTTVADIRKESDNLTARLTQLALNLSKQLKINSVSQVDCLKKLGKVKEPAALEHLSVKHQSLELVVKLAANVNHMLVLDKTLQSIGTTQSVFDRQQLMDAASQLATIHSHLLTRTDECERLLITVKKLLNIAPEQESTVTPREEKRDTSPTDTIGEPLIVPQNKALEWEDEFFINTGTEGDEEPNGVVSALDQLQAEDELVGKRLMRKQFQPILRQLRERLVPVEQSFKERERAAMKRKGILLPEADEEQKDGEDERTGKALANEETDDESSGSDGSAVSFKLKRSQARYDEDRDFLASKAQFSLLAATLTKAVQMEESILE